VLLCFGWQLGDVFDELLRLLHAQRWGGGLGGGIQRR
jgi:hypothetical protein